MSESQNDDDKRVVQFKDIESAAKLLEGQVIKTSIAPSRNCTQLLGVPTFLKYENYQITGSFKVRGAYNKINSLTDDQKKNGIIASSAGNHAQGVAFSASDLGVKSQIVMPTLSPIVKQQATKEYGAQVILHGEYYDEAYKHAVGLAEENNLTFVHPYNDPFIIAGQGTIGIEVVNQLKDITDIIVPIGGGGLISGIAVALKKIKPSVRIYGVVSDNAPGMSMLYHNSHKKKFYAKPTIADGIAVKTPNEFMFETYIKKYVDEIITVTDDEIAQAIVFLIERAKTVVEGSGASVLAAAKKSGLKFGNNLLLLLSGGNIDLNVISSVIERGLIGNGRLARIRVIVEDRPGALLAISKIIAKNKVNVLEVRHDRLAADIDIKQAVMEFLIETTSLEQIEKVKQAITASGGKVL